MRFRSAVGVRGRKCCARGTLRGDRGDDRDDRSRIRPEFEGQPESRSISRLSHGLFFRQKSFKCTQLSELFSV